MGLGSDINQLAQEQLFAAKDENLSNARKRFYDLPGIEAC